MAPSFDLTQAPWISCTDREGAARELGIHEVLIRAHELRGLALSSPLETVAIHRFLLAILHRCFGPSSLREWRDLSDAGRFDGAVIEDYLSKWRHRFNLFHPERPFYQVRGLPFEADPVSRLVMEWSAYGVPVRVFEHRPSDFELTVSFAEAARSLITLQAYAPGGLVRKPGEPISATSSPLTQGAVTLLSGSTLFETLLFNLLRYDPSSSQPIAAEARLDLPAWEQPPTIIESRTPYGWLDLLTWQSRRLELKLDEEEARVSGVVYCVGRTMEGEVQDPMMVRYVESGKSRTLSFSRDRVLFRDGLALLLGGQIGKVVAVRPRTIDQLASPEIRMSQPERDVSINVVGIIGKQAKIETARHESMRMLASSIGDPEVEELIREGLYQAESVGEALNASLRTLARWILSLGDRQPLGGDITNLVEKTQALQSFWGEASQKFIELLGRLDAASGSERLSKFKEDLIRLAEKWIDEAADSIGASVRVFKAKALAESVLKRQLARKEVRL